VPSPVSLALCTLVTPCTPPPTLLHRTAPMLMDVPVPKSGESSAHNDSVQYSKPYIMTTNLVKVGGGGEGRIKVVEA
jgi:hypothetical protein